MNHMRFEVRDDVGYHWVWNGKKVYCVEARNEILENPNREPHELEENGYYADSWKEAIEILIQYGYIT